MLQTPNLRLAQILKVYQVSGPSGDVWPRLQSSEGVHHRPASLQMFRLWSSEDVVKRPWRDLKFGIPSGFGPISSLEFEAWDSEKFGQLYCTVSYAIYWDCDLWLHLPFKKLEIFESIFESLIHVLSTPTGSPFSHFGKHYVKPIFLSVAFWHILKCEESIANCCEVLISANTRRLWINWNVWQIISMRAICHSLP